MRHVAMIAPLATLHAVEETGVRCALKWPNDVQAGGKKLAGILIESEIDGDGASSVLVGIGLNVNFDPRAHDEIREIATSVAVEAGHMVDREPLLASLLLHFERLYRSACDGQSPLGAWRARLVTLGQHVKATMPGSSVAGVAEDVDDGGALIVRTASGERVIVEAGDVTLRN
jgi:BirA family biotin operon repressor/biotin-[acetyl-CoA-carboxylase] ligase